MSSLLFDTPGPRTRARHRVYTAVASLALLALLGLVLWRMYVTGQFDYELWEPFVTPDFVVAILVDGLVETLKMASLSVIFAVVFGLVFGIGKMSQHAMVRAPCWLVVEFFRAVPLLLLIIFIFFLAGTGDGFGSFWSVVFGLTLYNGSVLAEIFRAGIEAVPRGQGEAAYAIGLRKAQVMTLVLLPQAVKIMLPAIISQCVVALKDTSLGYYIIAPGLTRVGKAIYGQFGNQFQTALVLAALYIGANLVLTWLATVAQRRFVGEQKQLDVPMGAGQAGGA